MIEFTTTTAADTLFVNESQVIKIDNATSGSVLQYYNTYGDFATKNVIERAGDTTAAVGASITLTLDFSAADVLDSISVAGAKITTVAVTFATSDSVTLDSVAQSINLGSSSYTATRPTGTTLKITAPKANAQAFNGQSVKTFSANEATLNATQGTLSGGVSKGRDVLGLDDRLFLLQSGVVMSADHVNVLIKTSSGCTVWTTDGRKRTINSTTDCNTITDRINAL